MYMIKFRRNKINRRMVESVKDPHELILSLVDFGSIDADDMLVACVSEMSDAECKRVLHQLDLVPEDDTDDVEIDDVEIDDAESDIDNDIEIDDVEINDKDLDDDEDEDDDDEDEDEDGDEDDKNDDTEVELESRIRKLERRLYRRG